MRNAVAVIGACFGDEGKGLMTDYVVHQHKVLRGETTIVVRYNGGAQAGHTVVVDENNQHVFRHYGSGTFCKAPTFLGPEFICNPWLWNAERRELEDRTLHSLFIDTSCRVTTPYDVMINQEAERQRQTKGTHHGSCGSGINETIARCNTRFGTRFQEFTSCSRQEQRTRLRDIRFFYVPQRLAELGISASQWLNEKLECEQTLNNYLGALSCMQDDCITCTPKILQGFHCIVFEGAQGLLLDGRNTEFFPHLTPSRTGLPNVVDLLKDATVDAFEVIYVMRTYMTRHGRGPFPTEDPSMSFEDQTNVLGEFQEGLRFGALDFPRIHQAIQADRAELLRVPRSMHCQISTAMTHFDQFHNVRGGDKLFTDIGASVCYRSLGRTRDDVSAHFIAERKIDAPGQPSVSASSTGG